MHAAQRAPIRPIRAMFSALLAARQLLAVPNPGSGEVTAFPGQGQGRTGPCGAPRIQGSVQLEEPNARCILGQTLLLYPGWYPLTYLDCKTTSWGSDWLCNMDTSPGTAWRARGRPSGSSPTASLTSLVGTSSQMEGLPPFKVVSVVPSRAAEQV